MTGQVRWQAISGFTLHWYSWGNEHVVYNAGSGDTHLFNEFGSVILRNLQEHASTVEEIVKSLPAPLKSVNNTELHEQVSELVLELDRLGIVEQINQC